MEEAQILFDEAFEDTEKPTALMLPERVEKVRWFLLPKEAWEYGHGQTHLVADAFIEPKSYQMKDKTRIQSKHLKLNNQVQDIMNAKTQSKLSQNKSFKLYLHTEQLPELEEEGDEEEGSATKSVHRYEEEGSATKSVYRYEEGSATKSVYRWRIPEKITRSTTDLHQVSAAAIMPYASCDNLDCTGTHTYGKNRKGNRVKYIKKKLKSILRIK